MRARDTKVLTIRQYNRNTGQDSTYQIHAFVSRKALYCRECRSRTGSGKIKSVWLSVLLVFRVTHKRGCKCSSCWREETKGGQRETCRAVIGTIQEAGVVAKTPWVSRHDFGKEEDEVGRHPLTPLGEHNSLALKLTPTSRRKVYRWLARMR